MDHEKFKEYKTKQPEDMEPKDVAYCPIQDEFVKVKDIKGDGTVKGQRAYGDKEGEDIQITFNDIEIAFPPHSFGQLKRFTSKGTGFSKNGRKLKYPRNNVLDSAIDSYQQGEIKTEEFAEKVLEQRIMGMSDVVDTAKRAIMNVVGPEYEPIVDSREMEMIIEKCVSEYNEYAQSMDCNMAASESAEKLVEAIRDEGIDLGRKQRDKISEWWKNNLSDIWCPEN